MGKPNIPKRSDKDRQRRDPNDPENPCEGGGDNPPWGVRGDEPQQPLHDEDGQPLPSPWPLLIKTAVAERFVQHPCDDPFDFVALL